MNTIKNDLNKLKNTPVPDLQFTNKQKQNIIQHIIDKHNTVEEPVDKNKLNIQTEQYEYDRETILKLYRGEDLTTEKVAYLLNIKKHKLNKIIHDYKIFKQNQKYIKYKNKI